ncbi:Os08g0553450 [Oryza sativa Japonica Group]|uniref:Os08g0553450 protein n=1 Tax=Oryza sativa subsp. japonica TaxID=39947 RepID=C7J6D2_ORYSJ|nr:Os08g0553450 [Oryza sativa Japonica Group]|eukprot:NP_001175693.1 Os08g0553450 [Oryza sativa Japonica Group]
MRRSPPAAGEAATTLPAATPALEGSPRQDRGGLHQFWRRYPTNPNSIAHGICDYVRSKAQLHKGNSTDMDNRIEVEIRSMQGFS